jgi:hypothetical protein
MIEEELGFLMMAFGQLFTKKSILTQMIHDKMLFSLNSTSGINKSLTIVMADKNDK